MFISIQLNTEELSSNDGAVLAHLAGLAGVQTVPGTVEEATVEEAAPTTTKKTTAKKATPVKKAAPAKPEPEPEPEPVDDDPLGTDEDVQDDGAPTLEQAVELATKLVGDGKSVEVKKVLSALGIKRVSELKGDAIAEFVKAF